MIIFVDNLKNKTMKVKLLILVMAILLSCKKDAVSKSVTAIESKDAIVQMKDSIVFSQNVKPLGFLAQNTDKILMADSFYLSADSAKFLCFAFKLIGDTNRISAENIKLVIDDTIRGKCRQGANFGQGYLRFGFYHIFTIRKGWHYLKYEGHVIGEPGTPFEITMNYDDVLGYDAITSAPINNVGFPVAKKKRFGL